MGIKKMQLYMYLNGVPSKYTLHRYVDGVAVPCEVYAYTDDVEEPFEHGALMYTCTIDTSLNHKSNPLNVTVPGNCGGKPCVIDWGDGNHTNSRNYTYANNGIYTVKYYLKDDTITYDNNGDWYDNNGGSGATTSGYVTSCQWYCGFKSINFSYSAISAIPNMAYCSEITSFSMRSCLNITSASIDLSRGTMKSLNGALSYNSNLVSVSISIPGTVTNVSNLFAHCTSLSSAPNLSTNQQYTSHSGCYRNCKQLSFYSKLPSGWY